VLKAARRVLLVGNCYLEVEVFLRELPEAEFVIVDKSKDQLTRIERGLSGNQQKERLHLITADISDESLFPDGKKYDLIVLSAIDISCFSPDARAYEILHRIANNLQKWLAPGGILNHFTQATQKFYGAALQSGTLLLLDQTSNLKCVFRKNQLNAEE
jgi:SAM-dependent methyltransferase